MNPKGSPILCGVFCLCFCTGSHCDCVAGFVWRGGWGKGHFWSEFGCFQYHGYLFFSGESQSSGDSHLVNLKYEDAEKVAKEDGSYQILKVGETFSDTIQEGYIVSQNPDPKEEK